MSGLTITYFGEEFNIQVFLDNSCMFSTMPKHYDSHEVLHRCHKVPANNMVMHTGNGKVYFWIVIVQFIQQIVSTATSVSV